MLEVWLPLLSIAVITAWWYHALRLRERAVTHARGLCERHGLQLLDDSVALHRLHVSWRHGQARVTREYRFDTSLGGNDRRAASMTLLGHRIVSASLPVRETAAVHATVSPCAALTPRITPEIRTGGNIVPITRAHRTLH